MSKLWDCDYANMHPSMHGDMDNALRAPTCSMRHACIMHVWTHVLHVPDPILQYTSDSTFKYMSIAAVTWNSSPEEHSVPSNIIGVQWVWALMTCRWGISAISWETQRAPINRKRSFIMENWAECLLRIKAKILQIYVAEPLIGVHEMHGRVSPN